MTGVSGIDPTTLEWISTEIRTSLRDAESSLEIYQQSGGDNSTAIRVCANHLHQIVGTFQMVEIDTLARLAMEVEAFADAVADGQLSEEFFSGVDDVTSLLAMALTQIDAGLDRVARGAPELPLHRATLMNQLRVSRGADELEMYTLFYPDLDIFPAISNKPAIGDDEYSVSVRALRANFQRALLSWLKQSGELTPDELQEVVVELYDLARFSDVVRLWWIANAYIDVVRLQPGENARGHAQVFRLLDEKLHDLVTSGEQSLIQGVCDDLVRRMLYNIGMAARADHTGSIKEVYDTYDLHALFRVEDADSPGEEMKSVSEALLRLGERVHIDMPYVQQLMTRFFDSYDTEVDSLNPIAGQLTPLVENADELGIGLLGELASEIVEVIAFVEQSDQTAASEDAAFQLASAFMYIDQSLGGELVVDEDWHHSLESKISSLKSLRGEAVDDPSGGLKPGVTDGERLQLLKIVESEVTSTLADIEYGLETYVKDTSNTELLADLPGQFEHVRGVLLVAGEQKLSLLLSLAAEQTGLMYKQETEPTPALLEALAVATGAAQAFVQGLHSRQAERDELLERAISDLESAAGMNVSRADVEELISNSTESLNTWLNDVSDFTALTQLRRNLRDISRLSSQTGLDKVVELVEEENHLLDLVAEEPALLGPDVTATLKDSMACITELLIELYGTEDVEEGLEIPEPDAGPLPVAEKDDLMFHDEMDDVALIGDDPEISAESEDGYERAPGLDEGTSPLDDAGLREIFVAEASDNLAVINEWLNDPDSIGQSRSVDGGSSGSTLEDEGVGVAVSGDDSGFPDAVYVAVHTLKGNAHAVELNAVAEAYSAADDLLAQLAIDKKPLNSNGVQALKDLSNEAGIIIAGVQNGSFPDGEADDVLGSIAATFIQLREGIRPTPGGKGTGEDGGVDTSLSADVPAIKDLLSDEVQRELSDITEEGGKGEEAEADDIFCEDAVNVLSRIAALLPPGEDPASQPEVISSIREEFGLLKGSARAAGVSEIGDLAHAGEDYLSRIGEQKPGVDDEVNSRLAEIYTVLVQYVEKVANGQQVIADTGLLDRLSANPLVDDGDDFARELVEVYCEEAYQVLARIESTLELWQGLSGWADASEALQRDLHTLKGGARMVGADALGDMTHEAESLIERSSPADIEQDRGIHRLLQELHDVLLTDVHHLEAGEPQQHHDELLSRISGFAEESAADEGKVKEPPPVTPVPGSGKETPPSGAAESARAPAMRIDTGTLDRLSNYAGDVSVSRSQMAEEMGFLKETLERLRRNTSSLNDQLRNLELQADSGRVIVEPDADSEPDTASHSAEFDALELDRYSRLQKLSRNLLESMDELGSIESTLNTYAHRVETSLQQQERVNKELQDQIMRVRMVPFGGIAAQLRQIARQGARQLGKDVDLTVRGGEVELDRSVLEGVTEALEHMVRNAIDHGIENPEERISAQKSATGSVVVECRQQGREILISVSDDGRGLAAERLNAIAVEKGIIEDDAVLGDEEVLALISTTGFSSSEEVTQLSGRGVGMDVVRESLKRLGGSMELVKAEVPGTTFLLRLPLSLAITRAMYFRVGTHEYAATMRVIDRVVNLEAARVEDMRHLESPELEDRGETYSVIDLRDYLGHTRGPSREGLIPVLLVRAGTQNIAVVVDEVIDNQEIVMKPLGGHLASIPIYSGASVRANGTVVLVLDFMGIAYAETAIMVDTPIRDGETVEAPLVLVVDDSLTVRKAAQRDLAAFGIKVSTATDGIDAQRFLEERTPDLILLDIEMPRMDGFEFLEWLRQSDVKDLPVAVISSRSTDKYRDKALKLGANDFLGKPYRITDLLEIIRSRLGYEIEPTMGDEIG